LPIIQIIQIIFLIAVPFFVIKLNGFSKKLNFLSPILLCYILGIAVGNISFFPVDKGLAMTVSEFTVPLAIPLILFSTDFGRWVRLAKKTVSSFLFVIISVLTSSFLAALVFSPYIEEFWKLSGMLVGVYTGGTPNLMAIGMGLNVQEEILILANTSDVIMGGLYFLFLLSGAKWLLGKFLPPFKAPATALPYAAAAGKKPRLLTLVILFLLAVIMVAFSAGVSLLLTGDLEISIVMLLLTTLGIGASFIKKIRTAKGTYEIGQYLILIFSLAIGMTVDIGEFFSSSSIVFLYTAFVMTLAVVFHWLLATIFRIDIDTTIITSTAGIYGPAFIVPVAEGIKNREVVVSGLTCGLVGYALGNYLGFALAWLLKALF